MDERVMQFRVGVMVLASILITAILVLIFGQMPNFYKTYTIYVTFPEAPGVTEGTSVRKSGVLIGHVIGKPELLDGSGVRVTARIDNAYRLYPEERCRISYSTLGDAKLEFLLPPGQETNHQAVHNGAIFEGKASLEPIQMVADLQTNLRAMVGSVSQTSTDLDHLARKVDDLLDSNRGRIDGMIAQADRTMKAVENTMSAANSLLEDPELREQLKNTLKQAPALVQEAHDTLAQMRQSLSLVDTNLRNIQGFTDPLREHGPALVGRVEGTLQNIDTLTGQLAEFSRNLSTNNGTLGQLINNPELYQRLNSAVTNIDELIRDVRPMVRDLRPILNDARVFTDKIARHPESLGVRGALERNTGIK